MSTTNSKLSNPNLTEAEQEAIIGTFVRRYENERLRDRWMDKLSTDHQVSRAANQMPGTRLKKVILPIIAIAACLLLVFVLPGVFQDSGDQLMASYLTEATVENSRSEPKSDLEQTRTQLMEEYSAGLFESAIVAGEKLVSMPEATDEDRFHLGLAYLRHNNVAQAKLRFKDLANQPTDYRTEARFYLGISLLSEGSTAAGLEELGKIEEADGRKIYAKAQALIKAKWD